MTRRALTLAGLLLCASCATAQRPDGATAWRFPPSYRATQVVSVTLPDGARDFVASLRRAGAHVEVVLFEPALQVPLLAASGGDGPITETPFVEGLPPGSGRRLVEYLATMHSLDYDLAPDGTAVRSHAGTRYRLSAFVAEPGCTFPKVIEISAPLGAARVRVETTDVSCDLPGGGVE